MEGSMSRQTGYREVLLRGPFDDRYLATAGDFWATTMMMSRGLA